MFDVYLVWCRKSWVFLGIPRHQCGSATASSSDGWLLDFDSNVYQERDITTNPEWKRLYQYEIPKVLPDGTEAPLHYSHRFETVLLV